MRGAGPDPIAPTGAPAFPYAFLHGLAPEATANCRYAAQQQQSGNLNTPTRVPWAAAGGSNHVMVCRWNGFLTPLGARWACWGAGQKRAASGIRAPRTSLPRYVAGSQGPSRTVSSSALVSTLETSSLVVSSSSSNADRAACYSVVRTTACGDHFTCTLGTDQSVGRAVSPGAYRSRPMISTRSNVLRTSSCHPR